MNDKIREKINQDFSFEQRASVIKELSSFHLKHVMANSEYNLFNSRYAILKLAKGNVDEVVKLIAAAKIDYRDVIMWAMEEKS
jgi:hypothetical protein